MQKHHQVRSAWLVCAVLYAAPALGCEAPGVGDPCDPEQIPVGGFVPSEAYLETSSVQCRTRVCVVYQLNGFPNRDNTCVPGTDHPCSTQQETEDRIYCTCRCKASAGSSNTATLCDCPDGYDCREVLELGGEGIRGSYCVNVTTPAES